MALAIEEENISLLCNDWSDWDNLVRYLKQPGEEKEFEATALPDAMFTDGMMDLVTVMFLTRFDARPAHFFGLPGAFLMAIGFSVIGYVTLLRLTYGHILQRHPLLIFGVLVSLAGLQLFTSGLLGEMLAAHFQRDDDPSIIDERLE